LPLGRASALLGKPALLSVANDRAAARASALWRAKIETTTAPVGIS
jgi:hypothetical protein